MTVKEMHYDFKQKLNKIDSQQERDLLVPEIDWKLNEAQELLIKMIVHPDLQKDLGFELNQKSIDDIRTVVIDQDDTNAVTPVVFNGKSYIATLPTDHWYYIKSIVKAKKGTCQAVMKRVNLVQHDDEHEESLFNI